MINVRTSSRTTLQQIPKMPATRTSRIIRDCTRMVGMMWRPRTVPVACISQVKKAQIQKLMIRDRVAIFTLYLRYIYAVFTLYLHYIYTIFTLYLHCIYTQVTSLSH